MIVFPMAGLSRRFQDAGYEFHKFRLKAFGRTLFEHAVGGFSNYFGKEKFLFITLKQYNAEDFIKAKAEALGMTPNSYEIVLLDRPTAGQAETVAVSIDKIGLGDDDSLTIFNIDTFRPDFRYPDHFDILTIDGYLEVFRAEGDHWSFARPDQDGPMGRVLEVAEKKRISDLCSSGLYYFRRVGYFRKSYQSYYVNTRSRENEHFVAPLYNSMIENRLDVRFSLIDPKDIVNCGTPSEYLRVLTAANVATNAQLTACSPRPPWAIEATSNNFDFIQLSSPRLARRPLREVVAGGDLLSCAVVPTLRVLDYHGSYPTLFFAPRGAVSRYGLHADRASVIEETTQAAINADQRDEHAPNVIGASRGVLARTPTHTVPKAAAVSASWDSNYQHFLVETLSKIEALDSLLPKDVFFCVTDVSFVREMVAINYPDRRFLFLGNNDIVRTEVGAYGLSPTGVNMTHLTEIGINAIRKLRRRVLERVGPFLSDARQCCSPSIYIGRRQFSENHGNARIMLNETDLLSKLASSGYISITFEGLTLCEKAILLCGRRNIITPVGANIMNLIFASSPYTVGIISHTVGLRYTEFFRRFLFEVGSPLIRCEDLDVAFAAPDRAANAQQSYFVDINAAHTGASILASETI